MGSFWRGLFKVAFWFSFVAGIVFSFYLGKLVSNWYSNVSYITGANENSGAAIVATFAGIVFTVVIHAALGMLLEFFDNVALIKDKICGIATDENESDEDESVSSGRWWRCGYCLGKNPNYTAFCTKCGKPKNAGQAANTQPSSPAPTPNPTSAPTFWNCTVCGNPNSPSTCFCTKCGKNKP